MKLSHKLFAGLSILGLLLLEGGMLPVVAQESTEPQSAEPATAIAENAETRAAEPGYSRDGADSCLRCHGERSEFPVLDIFKTPHGSLTHPDSPFAGAQCESCHGPAGAHQRRPRGDDKPRNFGPDAAAPVEEQNQVCLDCHNDHGRMGWIGSIHDQEEVGCVSCHKIHSEEDRMEDAIAQQDVCFDCHPRTRALSLMPSSHPLRFGEMACSSCHDPHNGMNDYQLVETSVNDTCYTCHAEKRGPVLWEHAPVTEDCSLCHDAHGSNHAALLKQRPPLLCQQCHMPSGHPSMAYTSDSIEDDYASRFLLGSSCTNCHTQVHGSNHPSGASLER
ncbi:MAG TPA: DmsE family decaheme c-type cytochrome [Xanthomonadales bacterium]|nr:DmsE family decaheme c-type cytochrome [Xanthomonadales bacterium]